MLLRRFFHLPHGSGQTDAAPADKGFVLPLTLVVIASIGLVIAAVNEWVMQSVRDAQVISNQTETELAMTETREEFVYYMLMRPVSIRGLELGRPTSKIDPNNVMALMASDFQSDKSLQFDGTPYQVQSHPDFYLRIYDGRGLVNLNGISQPQVRRLLMQFQLSDEQRNSLADTLEDYIDRDDLTRISGAEAQDYKRVNRPPPANALLVTPQEAQSVLGWDLLKDLWREDVEAPVLTTCGEQGFNPNTATRMTLLANLPGVLEEDIAKIKERRAQKAFRNVREVGVVAGVALRDEPFLYTFIPGNCVIAELEHKPSGLRRRISLTIRNFNGNINPWYVDYALSLPPRNQDDSGSLEAAAGAAAGKGIFPTPIAVDPDQPADGPGGFAQPPNGLDPQP